MNDKKHKDMANFDFQQPAPTIQELLNSIPNKAEQTEVDELRALYEALTQSEIIPVPSADWPVSDPQQNVIYRVAGESSYTDYMWNGSSFIPMATYDGEEDLSLILKKNLLISLSANEYIDEDGTLQTASNNKYRCTQEYIPVFPSSHVKVQYQSFSNFYNAFYDSDKKFISSWQGYEHDVPDDAVYARFTMYDNSASLTSMQLEISISNCVDPLNAIAHIDKIGAKKIVCIGDSLTQGAGADMLHNYSVVKGNIQSVTGTTLPDDGCNYVRALEIISQSKTYNYGIGGETMKGIAFRSGANPIILQNQILLYGDRSWTVLSNSDMQYAWGGDVSFTYQAGANAYTPMLVKGIECEISKDGSNNVIIRPTHNIGANVTIAAGTPILGNVNQNRLSDIAVIWAGTNGGYSGTADAVEKISRIADGLGAKTTIVLGLYAWNLSQVSYVRAFNLALLEKFGSRFFDTEQYLTTKALADWGIPPTTDSDLTAEQIANGVLSDVYCMNNGILPSSLWRFCYGVDGKTTNDQHLNAAAYAIMGYKVYELLSFLNAL